MKEATVFYFNYD